MSNIIAITIHGTECAPETNEMVCRTFRTESGFGGAFAAIRFDAADYVGTSTCNKVFGVISNEDGSQTPFRLDVRANDPDPFAGRWADLGERFNEVHGLSPR